MADEPTTATEPSVEINKPLTPEEKARWKQFGKLVLVVTVLVVLMEGWRGHAAPAEAEEMLATWQRANAQVLAVQSVGTLKKPKTLVTMSYELHGKRVEKTDNITGHSELVTGQDVAILVSPNDPHETRLAGKIEARSAQSPMEGLVSGIGSGLVAGPMAGVALGLVIAFAINILKQVRERKAAVS